MSDGDLYVPGVSRYLVHLARAYEDTIGGRFHRQLPDVSALTFLRIQDTAFFIARSSVARVPLDRASPLSVDIARLAGMFERNLLPHLRTNR